MNHKEKSIIAQTILERHGIHCLVKTESGGQLINIITDIIRMSFTQEGKVVIAINMAADQMQLAMISAQLGGAFNHTMSFASPYLTTWDIETGAGIVVSPATHPDTFQKYMREHIQQLAVLSVQAGMAQLEVVCDKTNNPPEDVQSGLLHVDVLVKQPVEG